MITYLHAAEREERQIKSFQHFDDLREIFPKNSNWKS